MKCGKNGANFHLPVITSEPNCKQPESGTET